MPPAGSIRRYRPEDERAVATLWHRAGHAAYDFIPTWQAFTLERARKVFASAAVEGKEVWVAAEADAPIGFLALEGSHLDRLYVDPGHQGRGVGARLLAHAMELRPEGLTLDTHLENRRARRFYESRGFVPIRFGRSPAPESIPDLGYRWQPPDAPPPPEVASLLDALTAELEALFRDALVGLYLRGSLATGDFLPETSDVDVFAVPEHAIDEARFAELEALHARVAAASPSHGHRLEIAYVERAAMPRFTPGRRQATLGQMEKLAWHHHGSQWLIERAVLREHGRVLRGPAPASLIDPIDPAEVVAASRQRLREWVAWAADASHPEWNLPAAHNAYVVESTCRALHTLETGRLASKLQAVGWALDHLPEPWRGLVERSQAWRAERRRVDRTPIPEIQRFVAWAGRRNEETP